MNLILQINKSKTALLISIFLFLPCSLLFSQESKAKSETTSKSWDAESENINTDTLNEDGVAAAQIGDYKKAVKLFKKAVSVQDNNVARSYNNLAYAYLLLEDYDNAIESYRKALERNPNLLPALANIGKLYYLKEQFKESIEYGEKVLMLNPQSEEVRSWLPDAYRKAAEKRMYDLENKIAQNVKEEKSDSENAPLVYSKKPDSKVEMTAAGYYIFDKSKKNLTLNSANGMIPLPVKVLADIWPSSDIELVTIIENPLTGLLFPNFLISEESMKFIYHKPEIFYGIGVYFSQADFAYDNISGSGKFIHNFRYPRRTDTKIGFTIGSRAEYSSFIFSMFPRYLFKDNEKGPQSIEFDKAIVKVEYKLTLPEKKERGFFPWHTELAFFMDINETYITEYLTEPSQILYGHYLGVYDFGFDATFGKIQKRFNKTPTLLGISFTERLYYQKLDATNNFTFGNGQGFFGFDSNGAVSGNTFPTFKMNSHIFTLFFKQMFMNSIVFKEEIGMEYIVSSKYPNGLFAEFSFAATF